MGANLQRLAVRTSPHLTTPQPSDSDLTGRKPAIAVGVMAFFFVKTVQESTLVTAVDAQRQAAERSV
ncbi:MAG TPA: hypothetical protein VIC24_17770 [Gemmatimonadaceae bacterium]|jgi:hypothetical protein